MFFDISSQSSQTARDPIPQMEYQCYHVLMFSYSDLCLTVQESVQESLIITFLIYFGSHSMRDMYVSLCINIAPNFCRTDSRSRAARVGGHCITETTYHLRKINF